MTSTALHPDLIATRPAPRLSFRTRWTLHRARNVFIREQLARVEPVSRLDRMSGVSA